VYLPACWLALGMGVSALAGIVLAVVGLALYGPPHDFTQGRKQAVWTLVLSGVGIIAVAIATGIAAGRRDQALVSLDGSLKDTLSSDELNYRYDNPPKPYVQIKTRAINEDASFGIMRNHPKIMMICIAERTGVDVDLNTADSWGATAGLSCTRCYIPDGSHTAGRGGPSPADLGIPRLSGGGVP
jgi:hypothetical protein